MKLLKVLSLLALVALPLGAHAADKKILIIAGKPSHPPGMHEFHAGSLLLQSCLAHTPGVKVEVATMGWPESNAAFDGVSAVIIYADGGGKNPAVVEDHKQILDDLAKKGVGLGFMHYGVEVPADNGGAEFKRWIGGYYENAWSCNPMWKPEFQKFPDHPVTRGVKPFSNLDEWYINMRWADEKSVTPILSAPPSDDVRAGPYVSPKGPYPHIVAAKGRSETMMWVFERPDGGRGFGFTGGHTHANWGNDSQRKVVLNAMLWIAKVDVPKNGVESTVTAEQLAANLDPKNAPAAKKKKQ